MLEEHDTTHRYLKQTRYSKSLDHFQFSKTNNYCTSLYNISDILNTTTKQNVRRNNNIQNQKTFDQNFLLSSNSCSCYKNTSIDLNVIAINGTDKKYQTPVVKNTTNVKQKCQKLVKSLSHTPSESTQHIFKSNSMQILSPKLAMDTSNFEFMKNGCILEDFEEKSKKEKEEQATIKRLIEMGEYSSGSSTTETTSLTKKNKKPLKADALIVDFVALRKVRSAACLGECVSSVILSGTESLPNITSTLNENVQYIDVVDYSSSSSTCTSERSGWVSSRSSSITSLDTNKSNIGNGFLRSWSGIEKHLQSLTLDKITSAKRYQKLDKSKGRLVQHKNYKTNNEVVSETISNGVSEHAYEEIMLLPPKQFRDAPSPVSSATKKLHEDEAGAVDNILYHIYESPTKKAATHFSSQLKIADTDGFQGFLLKEKQNIFCKNFLL